MFVCKPQTALKERVGNVSFSAWKWTRVQLFLKVESCFIWEQIQARPWKRKWTNVSIIILRVNRLKISDIFFKNTLKSLLVEMIKAWGWCSDRTNQRVLWNKVRTQMVSYKCTRSISYLKLRCFFKLLTSCSNWCSFICKEFHRMLEGEL